MVLIARHHAPELIAWLDREVSANRPYLMPESERTEASRLNPYHVSTAAQIATWRGQGDLWEVRQSSRKKEVEVTCRDPQIETLIALKFSG